MIKSHEIKNVTDFNVADSVRRDIKVIATKTHYTVYGTACYLQAWHITYSYRMHACVTCVPVLFTVYIIRMYVHPALFNVF